MNKSLNKNFKCLLKYNNPDKKQCMECFHWDNDNCLYKEIHKDSRGILLAAIFSLVIWIILILSLF